MAVQDRRLELHERLCDLLSSRNVYFDPPESKKLEYPCIMYNRSKIDSTRADDIPYVSRTRYTVTYIDYDGDTSSFLYTLLHELPYCEHDRSFTQDNLHHDIFTIYW